MASPGTLDVLADRIGHVFSKRERLERSLTRPGVHTDKFDGNGKRVHENERLEFLGDRVLALVIAEWLMEDFPDEAEGDLTRKLNALVRKETCADVARQIELEKHLRMDRAERDRGVHERMSVLGDAMESLIAAVYLDAGHATARSVIRGLWRTHMKRVGSVSRDPKTALQEWAQRRGLAVPTYTVISRSGPDHNPKFEIKVEVEGFEGEFGCGGTKRGAERDAAEKLLRSRLIGDQGG